MFKHQYTFSKWLKPWEYHRIYHIHIYTDTVLRNDWTRIIKKKSWRLTHSEWKTFKRISLFAAHTGTMGSKFFRKNFFKVYIYIYGYIYLGELQLKGNFFAQLPSSLRVYMVSSSRRKGEWNKNEKEKKNRERAFAKRKKKCGRKIRVNGNKGGS